MQHKPKSPAAIRLRSRSASRGPLAWGTAAGTRRWLALLLLFPLFVVPSLAQDDSDAEETEVEIVDLQLDDATLERIKAEVVAAVSEHTGVSLDGLAMRVVKRSELREVLKAELEPQFDVMFESPEEASMQLNMMARVYSRALFAKYATGTDEVMISDRNFTSVARALKQPLLTSHDVVRAVLVHEAIHAADERLYKFSETLTTLKSRDEIMAFSAVMEGHAQYVARKISKAKGWTAEFEIFTQAIGERPTTGEAAVDYATNMQVAVAAAAYYDGEKFITFLAEHGGPEAVARAFREPPAETILIEEPGWYLDPSTRPALVHDFEPVLRTFAEARDAEGDWNNQVLALTSVQIAAAFSIMPREVVQPMLKEIRQAQMLVQLATDAPPGTVMIAAGLFEASSSETARQLLELENQLMLKKDEVMNKGQVKISDAKYRDVTSGPISGTLSSKHIEAGPQQMFAQTVVLRRDLVVLELSFVGDRWDEEEVLGLGIELLQSAHQSRHAIEENIDEDDDEE